MDSLLPPRKVIQRPLQRGRVEVNTLKETGPTMEQPCGHHPTSQTGGSSAGLSFALVSPAVADGPIQSIQGGPDVTGDDVCNV